MPATFLFFPALYFIIVSSLLFNPVSSDIFMGSNDVTTDEQPRESNRLKRTPLNDLPNHLKIRIQYENGEKVDMNWLKVNPYVANENLPIVIHGNDENSHVMKHVGEFIAFYDEKTCTSVVYFENENAFYGVIGSNYYVVSLPYNFDANGNYRLNSVGMPYIKKRKHNSNHIHPSIVLPPPSDIESWEDYIHPSHTLPANASTTYYDYSSRAHIDNHHIYFLEIMVFVARDIVNQFKEHYGQDHYLKWIVRYYIVYFHGVDMMFKKVKTLTGLIFINIAKIVIRDSSIPFEFLNNDELQFTKIITKLSNYLSAHETNYPEDSYDHVFIHTSRPIQDESVFVHGISRYGADLTYARKIAKFQKAVPITIMRYQYFHADYLLAVHELGRTLYINIDSRDQGLTQAGQCYSVMQRGGPACNNCLNWSEKSRFQLTMFLRSNKNRCFLVNYPRSLRRRGTSRLISIKKICNCYGYDSHALNRNGVELEIIKEKNCAVPLMCQDSKAKVKSYIIRPFDGVPCGRYGEVCWQWECVKS